LWIFFGIQNMNNEKVWFILQHILINIQITFIISHTSLHPFRLYFYFIAALILKFKQLCPSYCLCIAAAAAVVKGEIPPVHTLKAHRVKAELHLILRLCTKWGWGVKITHQLL
jgi:hypothetical protein